MDRAVFRFAVELGVQPHHLRRRRLAIATGRNDETSAFYGVSMTAPPKQAQGKVLRPYDVTAPTTFWGQA